jgi:PIF1-like helicase
LYSTLAISLEVNATSTHNFGPRSVIAQALQNTHIIIWDEAPMVSRFAIEAVDRTMQDALEVISHLKVEWFYLEVTLDRFFQLFLVDIDLRLFGSALKCHHCGIGLHHLNLQQICNYSHTQFFKTPY